MHILLSLQPPPLGIGFSAGSPTETMATSCFTTPDFKEVFIPNAALNFSDLRGPHINYDVLSDNDMDAQLPGRLTFPDLTYAPSGPGYHPLVGSSAAPQAPPTPIPPLIRDDSIDKADIVALLGAMPDNTPFPIAFKTLLGASMALWNAHRANSTLTQDFVTANTLDKAISATFDFFIPTTVSPI